ncbi:Glycosyl transferase family 2 [Klenkia soli]|uniref:Glycosyl transferase family 2 n=1 Tax=Klenkia soli TaxID=1052260 RepID=A0A1H0NXY2_9ACTN|nr:glycosyltransferase family 2 protein [Klenkia soli]SDO97250.1 Glycosyl transferase family 2 [Klenkia soli]
MQSIGIIILALNEEEAIRTCIESAKLLTSNVTVLDSGSKDQTGRIAVAAGAQVVQFRWNGAYPKKKQWSLDNLYLDTDWVLLMDADERLSPALASEIKEVLAGSPVSAFEIPVQYHWRGEVLRHGQTVYKRTMLRRGACKFPEIDDLDAPGSTEVEGHYQPLVRGAIGRLQSRLIHDDPDPIHDWFARHNRYSDWEAFIQIRPEVRAATRAAKSSQGRIFDRMPLKPVVIFIYNYFIKQGFRDGRPGFEFAFSLMFYHAQIQMKIREAAAKSQEQYRSN